MNIIFVKQFRPYLFIIAILIMFSTLNTQAQIKSDSDLYAILKTKDSLIFDYSFKSCDIEGLNELIAEDFEFYHDQGGVNSTKAEFLDGIKNGLCNPSNTTKSRRQLDTNSLEVFPMYNNGTLYGAIQTGEHRFFETTNGKERPGSIAKFSHLWILEGGTWKLKRVLSYDHKMPSIDSTIALTDDQLKRLEGSYKSDKMGVITIKRNDNHLLLTAGGKDFQLFPKSETVFKNNERPLAFEFVLELGKVQKLIVKEEEKQVDEALKIK